MTSTLPTVMARLEGSNTFRFWKRYRSWLIVYLAGVLGLAMSLAVYSVISVMEQGAELSRSAQMLRLLGIYGVRDSWLVLALCLLVTALLVERLSMAQREALRIGRIVEQRTRELSLANRKMEEMNRLKGEFVAQASHELRTPLTVIREGVAQLQEGIFGKPNPEQADVLHLVICNCDRLCQLIGDLLDLSKIESGELPLQKTPFDLGALVKEICAEFSPKAARKGLRLLLRVPKRGASVTADREKILQVITNLLRNALKFTDQGTIEVCVERDGRGVLCSVSDTGPGIPAGQAERLFHKFEQLAPIGSLARKGAGLGLAISRGIVEEHGGKIWVVSEPGHGARFIFSLPDQSEVMHAA